MSAEDKVLRYIETHTVKSNTPSEVEEEVRKLTGLDLKRLVKGTVLDKKGA